VGQKGSPGVRLHAPRSVGKFEGMTYLHDPFGHLKHKLWPKEGLGVKLAI